MAWVDRAAPWMVSWGLWVGAAWAQPYPTQPIRIVVAYPAGGGADSLTRAMAPRLGELLGQQIVVDNRPGGNTVIGTQHAAISRPDGYTLLAADSAYMTNPFLLAKLPYDTLRDFAPVVLLTASHRSEEHTSELQSH